MKFSTPVVPTKPPFQIEYGQKLISIGSCFSENIGQYFQKFKFDIVINPFGQQYNPSSIAYALERIIENRPYTAPELFQHNEQFHSFDHHSDYSRPTEEETLSTINENLAAAHRQLKQADVLFLTFGTAHIFQLPENGRTVSNCHKMPAKRFNKRMLSVDEITETIDGAIAKLKAINKDIKIVLTVSPVWYFAFGIEENTLSKSLLFVAIQQLKQSMPELYYFPAYEIVMDELRDYRYFAEDMLHPNYQTTNYVWEVLQNTLIERQTRQVMTEVEEIISAANHRPRNPNSDAHRAFQEKYLNKILKFKQDYPEFDFEKEILSLG